MSSSICLPTLVDIIDATQLAVSIPANTFKLALFDDSLVIDPESYSAYGVAPFNAGEVAASGGYATGGSALTTPVWAVQAGSQRVRYNTAPLTIVTVTGNFRYALHYDDTLAGNNAWYVCDLGAEFAAAGEDVVFTPDTNGWFRIRA